MPCNFAVGNCKEAPKTAPRAQELKNPLLCLPLAWICQKLASIIGTYITALQTPFSLYAWAPKPNLADSCSNYVWHLLDWWWSLPIGMTHALIATPKILLDLRPNGYKSMLKATKNELHFIMQSSWVQTSMWERRPHVEWVRKIVITVTGNLGFRVWGRTKGKQLMCKCSCHFNLIYLWLSGKSSQVPILW